MQLCSSVASGLGSKIVLSPAVKALAPAALAVSLVAASWSYGYSRGKAEIQARLDSYQASVSLSNARAQTELTAKFQTVLQDRENNLEALRAERGALLVSLRNRQPKPAPSSSQSSIATEPAALASCGPEQLYRENAEFLAGLAADAETVRVELLNTRAAYEKAGQVLADAP